MNLGILTSHPIQYQAPLFRELARRVDLTVYFAHSQSAQGQAKAGFNVAFDWDVDLLGGYEYQFLPNQSRRPSVSRFTGCDSPEIVGEIRQGRFDAFLVMGWYLKSFWQAIRACRRYDVPVMVRGDSQMGSPRSWLKQAGKEIVYPIILKQFDAFLYVGNRNREYLEHYGVPSERLFFSPHCIDNEAFSSRAQSVSAKESRVRFHIKSDQKVVLFVGKLLDRKRPLDLIEALHTILGKGTDVCAVFVGDGPLRSELEMKAKEYGVNAIFLGFLNQTEIPDAYAMADVLVLPSNGSETWGLVVNESLACGTPVVVSDAVGCSPDLVVEGKTGAVYPMGNTMAMAVTLLHVLNEPPFAQTLNSKIEAYSVSESANGVIDAMNWLIEHKTR